MKSAMTRRELLRYLAIGSAAVGMGACQPKVVKETVVVEKEKLVKETVEVEKVVKEVVEIEKEVTRVIEKVVEKEVAPREKVTLRIHTNQADPWYGVLKHAWENSVAGWRSEHPYIELKFEPVAGWVDKYYPKIFAHVAAGTLGDVVWHSPRHRNHVSWGVEYNIVIDLMPHVQATGFDLSQFFPGVVASSTWEGKYYWMPFISEPSCPVFAYNKDMMDRFGLQEPQNDWDYRQHTEWGVEGTRADVWGYHTGNQSTAPIASTPQFRQFGVKMVSDDGKTALPGDSVEALKTVLQWRHDLIYKHKTMPTPDPTFDVRNMFIAEKVLTFGIWPYLISSLPALLVKDKFRVGFVYTPLDKQGATRRNMLNEHVHAVTRFSKHPEVAFDYLVFHSSKDACILSSLLTGFGAPVGRPDLYEDPRAVKVFPGLTMLEPIMKDIEPDFFVGNWRGEEFDREWNTQCDNLLLDKIGVDEAVDSIKKNCQAVLDMEPA